MLCLYFDTVHFRLFILGYSNKVAIFLTTFDLMFFTKLKSTLEEVIRDVKLLLFPLG